MHQSSAHQVSHPSSLLSSTETSSPESDSSTIDSETTDIDSDTSDSNLANISKLLMAEPTETTKPTTKVIDNDDEQEITREIGDSSHSVPPQPKVPKPSNGP